MKKKKQTRLFSFKKGIATTLLLILMTTILSSCIWRKRIDASNEGILVHLYGKDKGKAVEQVSGAVWYNTWTTEVHEFPTYIQTADYEAFEVNAKSGETLEIDPKVTLKIGEGKSIPIFYKYRKDIEDILEGPIRTYTYNAFRNVANLFTISEVLSQTHKFDSLTTAMLSEELRKDGFEIDQLTYSIKYPENIIKSIEEKTKAEQETVTAMNNLIKDSINARRLIVQAEGEKKANELKQSSLTSLLIQQKFIEKWDGKTPLYGDISTMILK